MSVPTGNQPSGDHRFGSIFYNFEAMLFFLLCLLLHSTTSKELVLVQTLWRHGDRTPLLSFDDNPHQEAFWGLKWGELTKKGMAEHYQQGLRLKQRYINELEFLDSSYKIQDVYIRSTDLPRTLMSAYCNLAGFYSNSTSADQALPMNWTPVPVHTVDKAVDFLLNVADCDRKIELLKKQQTESKEFLEFIGQHEDLVNEISERTKLNFSDIFLLEKFYDSMRIEKLYNLTAPQWYSNEMHLQLKEFLNEAMDYVNGNAGFGYPENVELIRITGGVLLNEMINAIDARIKNANSIRYYAYSAHDTTMNALLRALGAKKTVVPERMPDYASTLALELWKMENDDYSIRLMYSANARTNFKIITSAISGCPKDDFCPLDVFIERSQDYVNLNPQQACKSS